MKKIFSTTIIGSLICINSAVIAQPVTTKTIGIVVPLEHQAMTEIVSGFKQELKKKYKGPVKVIVKNAEHDINLEHSILKQFADRSVNIVEPIGTDAMEMTLSIIKDKPVVGIAADFTEDERINMQPRHATDVLDEVNTKTQIDFIHQTMPNLKFISLIHSADNKVFPEVAAVKKAASLYGIKVQDLMAQQESDLYTLSKNINPDSQAIFILKDHLIVNAIATLTKQAEALKIPLISSDDGSVAGGASFALGVRESQIGKTAADVTAEILNGTPVANIPMRKLTTYLIFINKQHAIKQGVNLKILTRAANKDGYRVVYLGEE